MSATQSIVFEGEAGGGDGSFGTTSQYRMTKPPCQVGDLIVAQIATQERIRGPGALVKNTSDLGIDWTDVLTDGYSEPDTRLQYIIDDGVNAKQFWWVGTKIATSDDTLPGDWLFDIKSSFVIIGADRVETLAVAYRGATGVGTWDTFLDLTTPTNTITCPDIGYGARYFDPTVGGFGQSIGISMQLLPAVGSLPLLLCGGTAWFCSHDVAARAPLAMRGQVGLSGVVTDRVVFGENAPLTVHVNYPWEVGHDAP